MSDLLKNNPALEDNDDFLPALCAGIVVATFMLVIIFCAVMGRVF